MQRGGYREIDRRDRAGGRADSGRRGELGGGEYARGGGGAPFGAQPDRAADVRSAGIRGGEAGSGLFRRSDEDGAAERLLALSDAEGGGDSEVERLRVESC